MLMGEGPGRCWGQLLLLLLLLLPHGDGGSSDGASRLWVIHCCVAGDA
jgi:hypothetical protein